MDVGDEEGYVAVEWDDISAHGSTFLASNPDLEDYSTGDRRFPDIDMHLGMILGMNSATSLKTSLGSVRTDERVQIRLKFLEDSVTVMQTRNQNLITENRELTVRLQAESLTVAELRSRLDELEGSTDTGSRIKDSHGVSPLTMEKDGSCKEWKEQALFTDGIAVTSERGSQCWAVCRACQQKLEGSEFAEPTAIVTKSELESLENDVQTLRNAVIAREQAWDRAMEREESYRRQLSRLSAESVTARHLSESRHNEIEALVATLAEKEAELKATRKDMLGLKKIIVKLERRLRDAEDNADFENADANVNPMSEKEQKLIEDLVRRQPFGKSKQRQRQNRKTHSTPSSLQSSPRFFQTDP